MKQLTHGSLFSGIGGFDLGFERVGIKTLWEVEIDEFSRRVLARHFPEAKRYDDVRAVGKHNLAPVDIISGGFPCQDISHAGKQAGIDGDRSGLWSEYARIIRGLRPRIVVMENVAALLVRGFERVLGDLAACGYDAEWSMFSACRMGAPHMRDRVYIVAYPNEMGREICNEQISGGPLPRDWMDSLARTWDCTAPGFLRMANGISDELDASRIGHTGNAIVPQIAEWIGKRLTTALGVV